MSFPQPFLAGIMVKERFAAFPGVPKVFHRQGAQDASFAAALVERSMPNMIDRVGSFCAPQQYRLRSLNIRVATHMARKPDSKAWESKKVLSVSRQALRRVKEFARQFHAGVMKE